jgi:hypothetical protein
MRKFNKNFKIGTKVKLIGLSENWQSIKSFENDRKLIKIIGFQGSWQFGHVIKYTNK